MSDFFPYICARETYDPYIPAGTPDLIRLAREVSDGFSALSGGHMRVGQLALFPLQRSVASHLLCDGREVPKDSFPQLYSYLGDTQGTPADPANFVLPNYIGAATFVPVAVAETETVTNGTVTSPAPSDPSIPAWDGSIYENADSGGRRLRPGDLEP